MWRQAATPQPQSSRSEPLTREEPLGQQMALQNQICQVALLLHRLAILWRNWRRLHGGLKEMGFRLGTDGFVATLGDTIEIERRDPADADAVIEGEPTGVAAMVYGGLPPAEAEATGMLRLSGDRALVERFAAAFPLPPKLEA